MRLWGRGDDEPEAGDQSPPAQGSTADAAADDDWTPGSGYQGTFAPVTQAPSAPSAAPTRPPISAEIPITGYGAVTTEDLHVTAPDPRDGADPVADPLDPDSAPDEYQPTATSEIRTSRSGRNLTVAAIVGFALFGLVVAAAWYHPLALAGLIYLVAIGAIVEWRRALVRQDRAVALVPALLATVGMGVATWFLLAEGLVVALLVGCAGVVAWRVGDERVENTLSDSLASIFTIMWIPFLLSFVLLMAQADNGWIRVVILLVAVAGNDTGALFAGMAFGRRKLAPRVSPKKTWEGAIGGLLLGAGVATGVAYYLLDGQWWIGAIVGVAAVVAGVLGDLAESSLKRDLEVKDMSGVIPGHGGILDRIDSVLLAAPAAYVVFALLMGTI